jgi:hypothetical protein
MADNSADGVADTNADPNADTASSTAKDAPSYGKLCERSRYQANRQGTIIAPCSIP